MSLPPSSRSSIEKFVSDRLEPWFTRAVERHCVSDDDRPLFDGFMTMIQGNGAEMSLDLRSQVSSIFRTILNNDNISCPPEIRKLIVDVHFAVTQVRKTVGEVFEPPAEPALQSINPIGALGQFIALKPNLQALTVKLRAGDFLNVTEDQKGLLVQLVNIHFPDRQIPEYCDNLVQAFLELADVDGFRATLNAFQLRALDGCLTLFSGERHSMVFTKADLARPE